MKRALLIVLILLVQAGLVLGTGGSPDASFMAQDSEDDSNGPFSTQGTEVDQTVTEVSLHPDSSATFTIEIMTRLDENGTKRQAFERYQKKVRENTSKYLKNFRKGVINLISDAEKKTGRQMEATNFSIETEIVTIPRERGVVRYEFEWSNFSVVSGDKLRVEDTLTEYRLQKGDSLIISFPNSYGLVEAFPAPDSTSRNSVTWEGPSDFSSDEPRLVVSKSAGGDGDGSGDGGDGSDGAGDGSGDGASDGGDGGDGGDGTNNGGASESGGFSFMIILILVVVVGVAGYYVYRNPEIIEDLGSGSEEQQNRGEPPGPSRGGGSVEAKNEKEEMETEDEEEIDDETIELENLSDTERILYILESSDGRVKQKELVNETGWSEAKVSQVTSKMEDEGDIQKLRMGRENIVQKVEDDGEENQERSKEEEESGGSSSHSDLFDD